MIGMILWELVIYMTTGPKGLLISARNFASFHWNHLRFFSGHKKGILTLENFLWSFHVSICSKSEPDPRDRAKISRFPVLIDVLPNVGSQFWMHQMKGEMRTFRFRYSLTVRGPHNPLPQYRYCSDFQQNPPWNSISVSGRIPISVREVPGVDGGRIS